MIRRFSIENKLEHSGKIVINALVRQGDDEIVVFISESSFLDIYEHLGSKF